MSTFQEMKTGWVFLVPISTSPLRVCQRFGADSCMSYREIGTLVDGVIERFSEPMSPVYVGPSHPVEQLHVGFDGKWERKS